MQCYFILTAGVSGASGWARSSSIGVGVRRVNRVGDTINRFCRETTRLRAGVAARAGVTAGAGAAAGAGTVGGAAAAGAAAAGRAVVSPAR